MSKHSPFNVFSEIGNLKKILLHRPGKEIERLVPELLEELLFDDIPYLKKAQKEHDRFAEIIEKNGIEVVYLEDLMTETLKDNIIKKQFLEQFLDEAKVFENNRRQAIKEYLLSKEEKEMVSTLMAGVKKSEIKNLKDNSLKDIVNKKYPFIMDPMPNLYFTRDPFAVIGNGVSLNHMYSETRNRETIFGEYIFKYHPEYKTADIPMFYDRDYKFSLEGGDELVLSNEIIAIGISQRTDPLAIEKFAHNIFDSNQSFSTVLAFQIPKKRAFMHLDTVFTMVDYDKFTIHAEIEGPLKAYSINRDGNGNLNIMEEKDKLANILKKYLGLNSIDLIKCAGGDYIDAGREQWNDGSNTLAIAPGEVIVYSRNYVTNRLLKENGIKLHEIPSSELSRGRGGPRCMSMPLYRESI